MCTKDFVLSTQGGGVTARLIKWDRKGRGSDPLGRAGWDGDGVWP